MASFNFGKNLSTFAAAKICLCVTPGIIQVFGLGYDKAFDTFCSGCDNEEQVKKENKCPAARMLWHQCWSMSFFIHGYIGIKSIRSGDPEQIKSFLIQSLFIDTIQALGLIYGLKHSFFPPKTVKSWCLFSCVLIGSTIYAIKKL